MAKRPVSQPVSQSLVLTKAQVLYEHPLYAEWKAIWQKLQHVREGTGGFLDGTYLVAHPREWEDHSVVTTAEDGVTVTGRRVNPNPSVPTSKLKARRKIARYENFAATIIDTTKAALFRQQPTRIVGDEREKQAPSPLEAWWQDVDGAETHIDDFLAQTWDPAGTFGHALLYMDRPAGEPGQTAADAQAPFLRVYTPLDVIDWLEDDFGRIVAVKFLEAAPRTGFDQRINQSDIRVRLVTDTAWTLYNRKGEVVDGGDVDGLHHMGICPVVQLYGRRRPLMPRIGQSLLKDPNLFVDLYNLTSELRELLRNQTFSILNVPLGSGQDQMSVTDAEALLSRSGFGTDRVLFSGLAASFISSDAKNVTVYQEERAQLIRQIFRLTGLAWESDSKDAEAEGSLKLKREDLNQQLSALADELEKADYAIAKLWYRATAGADRGEQQFEQDKITIRYPEDFDPTPFAQILEQAQAAISLGMPIEVKKQLLKRLIPKFLPDLLPDETKKLEAAVDAMQETMPADDIRKRIDAVLGAKDSQMPKADEMPMKGGEAA